LEALNGKPVVPQFREGVGLGRRGKGKDGETCHEKEPSQENLIFLGTKREKTCEGEVMTFGHEKGWEKCRKTQ